MTFLGLSGGDPSPLFGITQLVSQEDIVITNNGASVFLVKDIPIPTGNNKYFMIRVSVVWTDEDGDDVDSQVSIVVQRDSAGALTRNFVTVYDNFTGPKEQVAVEGADAIRLQMETAGSGDMDGLVRIILWEIPLPNVVLPVP